MDIYTAKKIGEIISPTDGGCHHCVGGLIDRLNSAFPEYDFFISDDKFLVQPDWSDDPEDAQSYPLVKVCQKS